MERNARRGPRGDPVTSGPVFQLGLWMRGCSWWQAPPVPRGSVTRVSAFTAEGSHGTKAGVNSVWSGVQGASGPGTPFLLRSVHPSVSAWGCCTKEVRSRVTRSVWPADGPPACSPASEATTGTACNGPAPLFSVPFRTARLVGLHEGRIPLCIVSAGLPGAVLSPYCRLTVRPAGASVPPQGKITRHPGR